MSQSGLQLTHAAKDDPDLFLVRKCFLLRRKCPYLQSTDTIGMHPTHGLDSHFTDKKTKAKRARLQSMYDLYFEGNEDSVQPPSRARANQGHIYRKANSWTSSKPSLLRQTGATASSRPLRTCDKCDQGTGLFLSSSLKCKANNQKECKIFH